MADATMTSKGQVTVPVEVRRALGLTTGSRVTFVPTSSGSYEMFPVVGSITALKGIVASLTRPVTLDEMDAAIAGGAARGNR